jgi:hypothetical protein
MAVDISAYVWRKDEFIRLHEIGPYTFVEFWNGPADNAKDKRHHRAFGAYIDERRTGCCYNTLDEALAGVIATRHDGINTRADSYFIRAIGAPSMEEFKP